MIDTKRTLINLHERFPNMSLDDLFAILECIQEQFTYSTYTTIDKNYVDPILEPKIY